MATEVKLPRLGQGMESGTIVKWLKSEGERVGAKFVPLPFAPVMEEYVVPHARDVLAAIQRTVQRNGE